MKQPHKKVYYGDFGSRWIPVELTGVCKKITGGPGNREHHYYQVRRRLFGIPVKKYWIHKEKVEFFDPVVETIYECKCGEEK